jgi:hypothetical protein
MPYTTQELEGVEFYKEFVDKLRNNYLLQIKDSAKENFRRNNVLYLYEDIFEDEEFGIGLGIESIPIDIHNEDSYKGKPNPYKGELDNIEITGSVTMMKNRYPKYIQTPNLERIIDRSISELSEFRFLKELPEGVVNGDIVTTEDADDFRKWLIENGQKRIFPDIASFYASNYSFSNINSVNFSILKTIPNGEPVE